MTTAVVETPCVRCVAGTAAPGHVCCQRCIDEIGPAPDALPWRLSVRLVVSVAVALILIALPWWVGAVKLAVLAGRLLGAN